MYSQLGESCEARAKHTREERGAVQDLVRHDRQTDTQDGGLHLPDGGRGGLCRQRDHLPGLGVSQEAAGSSDDYHHSVHHGGEHHLQRCGSSVTRYSLHELQVNTRNICSHYQHNTTGWRFILIENFFTSLLRMVIKD